MRGVLKGKRGNRGGGLLGTLKREVDSLLSPSEEKSGTPLVMCLRVP